MYSSLLRRALGLSIAIGVGSSSYAASTFAFQGLYAGNDGAFTGIESNSGETSPSNRFTTNASFSGLDRSGNSRTMSVEGSAWSSSQYGKIRIEGEGTITNSYFNTINPAYFDGNLNELGSPDLLAINGNAGFSDELLYTGIQGGYKVNFYFYLTGSASGDTEAGLNFSTNAPGSISYNPRTRTGGQLWITPWYDVSPNIPLEISADFYAGMNTYVSTKDDGSTYSSKALYGNTLTLAGMTMQDASGSLVTGWTVNAASGTNYPTGAVPEPATVLALSAGLVALINKRKR